MKSVLLICFIVAPQIVLAQIFIHEQLPVEGDLPFKGVFGSSVAFADIDGDNDQDLFITGKDSLAGRIAKLYINETNGQIVKFTEATNTPFEGVDLSSIAIADIDGDNDQDLIITGLKSGGEPMQRHIAELYINDTKEDGTIEFTEVNDTPFEGVSRSSVAFADIDGDNDQDLIITGQNYFGRITRLYANNGQGEFAEITGISFEGVYLGSVAFADVDGDKDQDLLITGLSSNSEIPLAKLYTNDTKDGVVKFTEVHNTPFEGVFGSSIAFADVDGDNDQDLLITGRNNNNQRRISKLYINDSYGVFTELTGTPFNDVAYGSIAFADVDRDNDQDVLITGQGSPGEYLAKLYTNDTKNGTVEFTEVTDIPFVGAGGGDVAFADIDNDNDQDILITGLNIVNAYDQPIAHLYLNTLNTPSYVDPSPTSKKALAKLIPNPLINNHARLSYFSESQAKLHLSLSDISGTILLQQQLHVSKGSNTIPLDCSAFPKGTYVVELKQGDHSTSTKLVIQ